MIDKIKVALEQLRSEEAGRREDEANQNPPAGKKAEKGKTNARS